MLRSMTLNVENWVPAMTSGIVGTQFRTMSSFFEVYERRWYIAGFIEKVIQYYAARKLWCQVNIVAVIPDAED